MFGSRKLYRWMHKIQKSDVRFFEDEAHNMELIKLITIARLHSDVAVVARTVCHTPAHGITREVLR